MNWKSLAPVSLGVLLIAAAASAATTTTATTVPALSGSYAYSHTTFCQPTILVNYTNGTPSLINLNGGGNTGGWGAIKFEAGTVTFNPAKNVLTYAGTTVQGSPIFLQSDGGGPDNLQGNALAQAASGGKTTYSNTATTVTLGGQSYNAAYGASTASGIAEYVALIGLDSNSCANQWTLSRV